LAKQLNLHEIFHEVLVRERNDFRAFEQLFVLNEFNAVQCLFLQVTRGRDKNAGINLFFFVLGKPHVESVTQKRDEVRSFSASNREKMQLFFHNIQIQVFGKRFEFLGLIIFQRTFWRENFHEICGELPPLSRFCPNCALKLVSLNGNIKPSFVRITVNVTQLVLKKRRRRLKKHHVCYLVILFWLELVNFL
jgi:hypothetical protein